MSSTRPAISVIIPLFNGGRYIGECLESVLRQTVREFEIVVVDDASTDDGVRIVEEMARRNPGKVQLLSHPDRRNHGIAATRNMGIRSVSGDWIAFLDQDDRWIPTKLEQQREAMNRNPEAVLIYGMARFIDESGNPTRIDRYVTAGRGKHGESVSMFEPLLRENVVPSITVLVRREAVVESGSFEEGPRHAYEDWILWTKMAYSRLFVFLPVVLAEYRIHPDNYSRFRLMKGLDFEAEVHYITSVFSSVAGQEQVSGHLRRQLSKSITRSLLRARSWGAERDRLMMLRDALTKSFPELEEEIGHVVELAGLIPVSVARFARRVRRRIVRT